MENEKMIAGRVEELHGDLEWTNESYALCARGIDCGWDDDDTRGWMTMGPVHVEWQRDPYGDGQEDWVAVDVSVDGRPFEADGYPYLDDAVKDAAHTTVEWQRWCANDIRDGVVLWLEHRGEAYTLDEPQDVHDSWTIMWGEVSVRGYYTEDDGTFEWSVSNSETADYLDGDATDDADTVIDAMIECASDPMEEAWLETVAVETAEDDWVMRTSDDMLIMYRHSAAAYGTSRRACYEKTGYAEGRIELEYRVRGSEWRAYDEHLPEDEEDVRRMTREAYAWVRGIDD